MFSAFVVCSVASGQLAFNSAPGNHKKQTARHVHQFSRAGFCSNSQKHLCSRNSSDITMFSDKKKYVYCGTPLFTGKRWEVCPIYISVACCLNHSSTQDENVGTQCLYSVITALSPFHRARCRAVATRL